MKRLHTNRYVVVSDFPQFTVWDNKRNCDLFPTRGNNRLYACPYGCSGETAQMIADALNEVEDRIADGFKPAWDHRLFMAMCEELRPRLLRSEEDHLNALLEAAAFYETIRSKRTI